MIGNAGFGAVSYAGLLDGALGIGGATLQKAWISVLSHLWQTTVFFLAVALLSVLLKGAPARVRHRLWSLTLLKLFLPVSMLGWVVEAWGRAAWGPAAVLPNFGRPIWFAPIDAAISTPASESPATLALLWLGTLAWLGTAIWILGRSHMDSRRIVVQETAALSPELQSRLSTLRTRLDLSPGDVVTTEMPVLPCVVGVLRPRLIFPVGMLEDYPPDALLAVGLHERAHLRRREPLRLFFQRLALALFFYFPPLWFVLGRLHRAAELACDEDAVAAGADARELSRAISRSLHSGLSAPPPAAALGSTHRSLLAERLTRLQDHRRYRPMRRHDGIVLIATLTLAGLVFAPTTARVNAAAGGDSASTPTGRDTETVRPGASEEEGSSASDEESNRFDVPPKPIADTMVMPAYPEEYRKVGATGRVLLRVFLSPEGVVSRVEEEKGIEGYPGFTKSAETAVSQWAFEPATLEGEPVAVAILIPFQFELD